MEVTITVIGLVEGKRKRADGSIHLGIHPLFLQPTEDVADFHPVLKSTSSLSPSPGRRIIQMICNSSTKSFPEISLQSYDLLSLITTGSYVQGIGTCATALPSASSDFLEESKSTQAQGREKYILSHLKLLRISPYPEHLSRVVSLATALDLTLDSPTNCSSTLSHRNLYNYFNEIISPKPFEISQEPDVSEIISSFHSSSSPLAMDYLSSLMTTQTHLAIKTHCHLMTTYHSSNRGSLKGMNLEVLDGDIAGTGLVDYELVKRPPRRRNRKISTQEKLTLQIYESFANQKLLECPSDCCLSCCCTDNEEPMSSPSDDQPIVASAAEETLVNLPAGDVTAPSHRGQSTRGQYLNNKKHPQIRWMTKRLLEMVQRLQSQPSTSSSFRLHIIDIGGGRGDLSVSLASTLVRSLPHRDNCSFHISVLDMNEKSLLAGKEFAESCHLSQHISFHHLDFRHFILKQLSGELSSPFFTNSCDGTSETEKAELQQESFLVVGLHICGDLTDLALEYVRTLSFSSSSSSAHGPLCCGFLIVPCCYSKCCLNEAGTEDGLNSEMEWRGWVQESRGVQTLIESNESLSLSLPKSSDEISLDWCSPMTAEKSTAMRRTLCTLAESNPRESQWRAMMVINILRLCHLIRELNGTDTGNGNGREEDSVRGKWNLSLETFARQHSLRNIVLCGEHLLTAA
jgi:hypothetical protein